MLTEAPEDSYDYHQLNRDLDKVKSSVFLGRNAAFLGSLMCSMNFIWTREISTAATDGVNVYWNPEYFLSLPEKSRNTDLMHELWHAALLHSIRKGTREHKPWNIACDIKIDLMLEGEGYDFTGIEGVLTSPQLNARQYVDWVEEDIYDDIMNNNPPPNSQGPGQVRLDILEGDSQQKQAAVNAVVQAMESAKIQGQAGQIPGAVTETISKFLDPVVPWEVILMQFFTDLIEEDYSWQRPNRRYGDMYLPSRVKDEGRLEHLCYYLDVSGSITEQEILRFNSEVKHIQTVLKPQKLTLVQFDTGITDVRVFEEDDPFDAIEIHGRGGTSLVPVRQHIQKNEPTAAIIFSDLQVNPMQPLTKDIPVIWVATGSPGATVPFGKLIHIR